MNNNPYNYPESDDNFPKIDYWEKQMEKADRFREEQKEKMLETAWEKAYEKTLPVQHKQK